MEVKNTFTEATIVARQAENKSMMAGIAHRMEVVLDTNEKTWINDSKSSCLESALYSLEEFSGKVTWIMGADQEDFDYKTLKDFFPENVSEIILFGPEEGNWRNEFKTMGINFSHFNSLEDAIDAAKNGNGNMVLFAPATDGFENYRSFRERGDHFRALVENL